MASNVKLRDIGTVQCTVQKEAGEYIVKYRDPDDKNGRMSGQPTIYGFGLCIRTAREAVAKLGQDLRKRGYTGTLKMKIETPRVAK